MTWLYVLGAFWLGVMLGFSVAALMAASATDAVIVLPKGDRR